MNLNEKIMKFLKIHFSSTATLIDGTPLQIEGDLSTGSKVSVITSDGMISLPDGEYKLEDESIIICKDGIIMDIIQADPEAEAPVETKMEEEVPVELQKEIVIELQKGNPEITGEDPTLIPEASGTTITEELPTEMVDTPIETVDPNTPVEPEIAILQEKIAKLEEMIAAMASKMNMISEKFSAAQPIVKTISDSKMPMDNKLQNKVDLLNRIRKIES